MNLSLSKLPWHTQLAVVAVLAVGCVGVFWNFHVVLAEQALDAKRSQLQALQAEVARGTLIARRLRYRATVAAK